MRQHRTLSSKGLTLYLMLAAVLGNHVRVLQVLPILKASRNMESSMWLGIVRGQERSVLDTKTSWRVEAWHHVSKLVFLNRA